MVLKIKEGMTLQEIEEYTSQALSEMTLQEKVHLMAGHDFFKIFLKDRGFGKSVFVR